MLRLREGLFTNPIWQALQTHHRRFALSAGDACRYPADVAPFAAVAASTARALEQLSSLLEPEEVLSIVADPIPSTTGLRIVDTIEVLQMVLPDDVTPPPGAGAEVTSLDRTNAEEMLALTRRAMPDYFRRRTHELGFYYGIRAHDELIAMAGERLMIDRHVEISGVCTRPDHRGFGYASGLVWQLVQRHRRQGLVSWLHVSAASQNAIALYLRMGFKVFNRIVLRKVARG
jgi:GNAT superfamily N-acetyltransferase